ncbi:flagellar hook-basal body complex protein FliE [Rhodopseudomonas julia]|uniref:Flagellar hook-basal body complex protein FliE n=1 Tax=Rhodopseudomonas julia TaxID=200617 RepID=A0ABU0C7T5_9BRAD|nr:flagellar hook-basal body complex protein FliE [Rhodopseudomonas julia]MDQ0326297.1 flagellar hook-basal body complex protein FliE [Rhodopseudomonas julia]
MVSPVQSLSFMVDSTASLSATRSTAATSQVAGAAGEADFGAVLANISGEALNTLKAGEAAAITGINGAMPVQDVVQAVMAAEQTLQASLAIRDKVVAAYQEISRMQI